MASNPIVLPAVNVNDELAKAVSAAINADELRAAVIAEAEKQSLTAADKARADAAAQKTIDDKAAADLAANGGKMFTTTETIGGKEFTFEAPSELELTRMVVNALKVAQAVQPTAHAEVHDPAAEAIAAAAAQAAEAKRIEQKSELELKFKRGEISVDAYLKESGAISDYLAAQGVSVEALKKTVDQSLTTQEEKSWEQATTEFLNTSDWPGGTRNLELMGLQLASMGLDTATDKVGAFRQAYAELKKRNMLFPGDETIPAVVAAATVPAVVSATTVPVVVPAATVPTVVKRPNTSSGLFGASSGAGATTDVVKTGKENLIEIPADATPAEILAAYKQANLAAGIDPNAAFTNQFRNKS